MIGKTLALVAVATGSMLACAAPVDTAGAWSSNLSAATCQSTLDAIESVGSSCFDVAPPDPGPIRPFATARSSTISYLGAIHQGRDELLVAGEPQWVLGRFLYGAALSLLGEEVDVYILRGCAGSWEKLGTTTTSKQAGEHAAVDGVTDDGGRVFLPIPASKALGLGRHRIRMVVAGDHSVAEQFIEVLPTGTQLLISDVDGTLTERLDTTTSLVCDEESVFPAIASAVTGSIPQARLHGGASAAYRSLVHAGYRPVYLTARPEFLAENTRRFLRENIRNDGRGDLPAGVVHTTLALTGAFNAAAQTFKTDELTRLAAKGFELVIGIGNRMSDVAAYDASKIPNKFFYENPDTAWRTCSDIGAVNSLPSPFASLTGGDYRFASFAEMQPAFDTTPHVCAAE